MKVMETTFYILTCGLFAWLIVRDAIRYNSRLRNDFWKTTKE